MLVSCARATRTIGICSFDARSGDHPQRLRLISGQHAVYKLESAQSDTPHAELTQGKMTNRKNHPLDGSGWVCLFRQQSGSKIALETRGSGGKLTILLESSALQKHNRVDQLSIHEILGSTGQTPAEIHLRIERFVLDLSSQIFDTSVRFSHPRPEWSRKTRCR